MNNNWFASFRRHAALAAPYLLALALPGGTIVALALWFFRGRHREA